MAGKKQDPEKKRSGASRAAKPGALQENSSMSSGNQKKRNGATQYVQRNLVLIRQAGGAVLMLERTEALLGQPSLVLFLRNLLRKEERANRQPPPSLPASQGALEAVPVEVDDSIEKGQAMEQMRREFEQKERLRQQEIDELNQRLAESAEEEYQRKRRKRIVITVVVCLVVLIAAGVGAFFGLKKTTDVKQEPILEPTSDADDGSNATDSSMSSNVPSNLPSSSPSEFVIRYDPPSDQDCAAVAAGERPTEEFLWQRNFLMPMDVVLSADQNNDETAQELKEKIQTLLMPELIGCISDADPNDAVNRKLQLNSEYNYVISKAIVNVLPREGQCVRSQATTCLHFLVTFDLFLEGLERILTLMELINIVFGYDQDLVQKLDLSDPYVELILVTISAGTITEAPSMVPSMVPSEMPSLSPSTHPTLAPAYSSRITPSAKRPTGMPSFTPSLRPSTAL
ncbi:unnamed protein product [Cylindrotheca closterium]|uniref:Uncharacterized protein n=1 Tax=Cylindrotheca closterium TaxID=2856 RepID=A0AAD2CIQ2_9STRA|nr:unnamed protein product [Cylindrotheca closterium]